uniref:RNA 2-O ribose methyltransferase substrate binding domain-containing protein n=2 Tax=Glossina morsitans morsitans TaxID=37546 RepID=A0ABK9NBV4_GLOMM
MLVNICKNIRISLFKYPYNTGCRELSDMKKILSQEYMTKIGIEKEKEECLLIEKNLFEQSLLQHKPVTAAERLESNTRTLNQNSTRERAPPPKALSEMEKRRRLEKISKSEIINDKELGFEFTKLSLTDSRLTTMMTTVRSKKRRDKNRQIVIEGRRLILEALECGLRLKTILFSQRDQLAAIKEEVTVLQKAKQTEIYKVPHHDLKIWSTLTTPPGVLAIFERPCSQHVRKTLSKVPPPLPITVVCDNIRDPNNLGSIIRTCAALPCLQVVITIGCCDPWESKSLRGGCGGHFRIQIHDDVHWEEVPLVIPAELADNCWVFIAENNISKSAGLTNVLDYTNIEQTGSHSVVIIGGESHGVSTEAYQFMQTVGNRGRCLHIPVAEGIDSLNVASALTLILYELRKHVLQMQNCEI